MTAGSGHAAASHGGGAAYGIGALPPLPPPRYTPRRRTGGRWGSAGTPYSSPIRRLDETRADAAAREPVRPAPTAGQPARHHSRAALG